MFRTVLAAFLAVLVSSTAMADRPHPILPRGVKYNATIPTPQSYLGFGIGERHIQHHELVGYLRALAAASDRVTIEEYARSYGHRPLVLLTITSPANHKQLAKIRQQHIQLTDAVHSADVDIDALPAVIYMGYSVHGNEPSGGNVAPLVAYYLAAATGTAHEKLLDELVILLDPCLNPDGFSRFAHWANNNRGHVLNADPNHREHQEPWPSGRTNYYWFDLNRDWLPAQHPESQGRLKKYHEWKPNVLLDFHEMGTDSTYFFQPGAPNRNNPLTPRRTIELTHAFAKEHAAALDGAGSLYYSEEGYDDFYMGKGSTYPDLHGAVGILFEQASARGHLQNSENGPLSFTFAIRNHWLTSMSSLRATLRMRRGLLEHKREFYRDAQALVRSQSAKGYVVAAPHDPARLYRFLEVLARHDIQAYRAARDISAGGETFLRHESYVIPAAQREFRFLQDLFAKRTTFAENVFYDVSAWTLPLAFQIRYAELDAPPNRAVLGEEFRIGAFPQRRVALASDDLAYIIRWTDYYAPKTLYALLSAGVRVKVATKPFQMVIGNETQDFDYGTLLVPLGIQPDKRQQVVEILHQAGKDGVDVYPARSGLTPSGIDLGSRYFREVRKPSVLLVTGTSPYEVGEVWHLLDRRMEMPVTLVEPERLDAITLRDYTVVVLVGGKYDAVSDQGIAHLKSFLDDGGTVVATGTSIQWLDDKNVVDVAFRSVGSAERETGGAVAPSERRPYAAAEYDAAFQLVRGAIFQTHVDHSHPVGYGFSANEPLPVFRNNRVFLELTKSAYATPVVYDEHPLLSGYISAENLKTLARSASVVVDAVGRGRAILIAEDPNFRAFWYGTNRVFLNSVFFGPITRVP